MARIFNSNGIAITDKQGRPLKSTADYVNPDETLTKRGIKQSVEQGRAALKAFYSVRKLSKVNQKCSGAVDCVTDILHVHYARTGSVAEVERLLHMAKEHFAAEIGHPVGMIGAKR